MISEMQVLTIINFGKTCILDNNIVKDPYFWSIIPNNRLWIKSKEFMKYWIIRYDTHTKKTGLLLFRSKFHIAITNLRRERIMSRSVFIPASIFGFLDENLSSKYLDNYNASKITLLYEILVWLYKSVIFDAIL